MHKVLKQIIPGVKLYDLLHFTCKTCYNLNSEIIIYGAISAVCLGWVSDRFLFIFFFLIVQTFNLTICEGSIVFIFP